LVFDKREFISWLETERNYYEDFSDDEAEFAWAQNIITGIDRTIEMFKKVK
jgi:hypothetical protein